MILPKPQDTFHKIQLYRLLTEILDDPNLSQQLYFKGGTCASMLGFLDRFSVDLDFDLADKADKHSVDNNLTSVFNKLKLSLKQKNNKELMYVLGYESKTKERNSLKLSILKKTSRSNVYQPFYLAEIDRFAICQTIETMFSHKLVSITDRFAKYKMIAGRDLYDIHHYFMMGYRYVNKIIEERTNKSVKNYLLYLSGFIEKNINERVISEDLNFLLPHDKFNSIRKVIKKETLMLIKDEINRI